MKRWFAGFMLFFFTVSLSACGLFGGSDDIRDGRGGRVPADDVTWHTVTFDSQGGSAIDQYMVSEGSGFILSQVPTRRGYTFTGWYVDAQGSALFSGAEGLYDSVTVYAGWSAMTYNLLFFVGDAVIYSGAYGYEDVITYPDPPAKLGRDFSHWTRNDQTFNRSRMPDEDVTLTAVYSVREYHLSFSTNVPLDPFEPFMLADIPYTIDTVIEAPEAAPLIEGWTFVGFFADPEGDIPFDFSQPPFPDEAGLIPVWALYTLDESH
ncbi:MAG: hypothetical protein EA374_02840 [Acholeplasmatales bacterium]|nr:MAG: hypothetical protein EA374_02840 [Acholeplasmatales bacterium]